MSRESNVGRKSSKINTNTDLKFDVVREESSSDNTSSMSSESADDDIPSKNS